MNLRTAAAALAASALLLPSAAVAGNGHGKDADKHVKKDKASKAHGKKDKAAKTVMFVFKGTFTAPGTVTVTSGNAHVRKGGFVGQAVAFDLSTAKLVVDDVNADGVKDLADVADGDKVKVQARVAKGTAFVAPAPAETDPVTVEGETPASAEGESAAIVARKLIDKSAGEKPESDEQPAGGEPEGDEVGDDAAVAQPAS